MSILSELNHYWKTSGLNKDDNVFICSDFTRIIYEFKKKYKTLCVEEILYSLINYFSDKGTVVLPTFNFDFSNGKTFDILKTVSRMGVVTELARLHDLGSRSLNPVYSFVSFGKNSHQFKSLDNKSFFSKDSPFGIFHKNNYKLCSIDLIERNGMPFLHYCEEFFRVKYRCYKVFEAYYIDYNRKKSLKKYRGYVRNLEMKVETDNFISGEMLWDLKLYKGNRPYKNNGIRFIYSQDYFNFFEDIFKKNKCLNIFYKIA